MTFQPVAPQRRAARASVCVAGVLVVLKLLAYYATGSVAILSSLVDSALDAAASILNMLAIGHALEPPDEDHRFGHGKAEALAGLGQAAFITASGGFLLVEAGSRLVRPSPIDQGLVGIAVMVASIILTLGLVRYQRRIARQTGSLAVAADSVHYLSDLLANVGVIAALILAVQFGLWWADPLFAAAAGLYILISAWRIGKVAWDQLMDREASAELRAQIEQVATGIAGVEGVHDLRTRLAGARCFIQMHIEMDGTLPLVQAHAIAEQVEAAVRKAVPRAEVLIHEDPV